MARKICEVCGKRAVGTTGEDPLSAKHSNLCGLCYDEAGWENTHNDAGHKHILELLEDVEYGKTSHKTEAEYLAWKKEQDEEISGCWICFPELNKAQNWKAKTKGTKKAQGFRRTQLNHKYMCTHPQTPKARRTCKNAFWAGVKAMVTTGKLTEDQAWEHCIKALQAPPVKKPTPFTVAPKGHVGVGSKSLKAIKEGK
jgi:hypothetical protein